MSQQKPLVRQMKGALGKLIRKNRTEGVKTSSDGAHWRRSVNVMLQSHSTSKAAGADSQRFDADRSDASLEAGDECRFLLLPKEIRHLIEDYLPQVDAVCLRQSCHTLRYESNCDLLVRDLSSKQLYSLRTRLDRECFWYLCELEQRGELGNQLAVCSFCQSLHDRRSFPDIQLRLLPQERVCTAYCKNYLICGKYRTSPSNLRLALGDVLATGRAEHKLHHWILDDAGHSSRVATHIVLSQAIEKDSRIPERRSTLFVEDTGLVLEHHFHLASQTAFVHISWDITSAILHSKKGHRYICPHHTIQSATTRLGNQRPVDNQYLLCCHAAHCRTEFAFFECPGETAGWTSLCFRVKRRFGWIENVVDTFGEVH